jgi:hypothetical protein
MQTLDAIESRIPGGQFDLPDPVFPKALTRYVLEPEANPTTAAFTCRLIFRPFFSAGSDFLQSVPMNFLGKQFFITFSTKISNFPNIF